MLRARNGSTRELPIIFRTTCHDRRPFVRQGRNAISMLKSNVLKTKLPGLKRYCDLRVFVPMSSDRIIVDAIKVAQNLLNQNLPPAHNLTDAATVLRFRELVRSQSIRSALERSSDTLFAFALRAVERVTSDHSKT